MSLTKEQERRLAKLDALEAGGVDNWEWYSESLKEWYVENEIDELSHDTTIDIISELSFGYYEPSERGSGVAFNEDRIEAVEAIIKELLTKSVKELKGE